MICGHQDINASVKKVHLLVEPMKEETERVLTEKGLLQAVLRGDESAWNLLYGQAFRPVYAFVFQRAGRDVGRTDEIVQETWMVAVTRIRKFDPARASFETWLCGIARNVLRNHSRKWARDDRVTLASDDVLERPTRLASSVEKESLSEHRVALALTVLPSAYQNVLRAKYEEHRSISEIALRWGRSQKAVESLLFRARTAFRQAYAEESE